MKICATQKELILTLKTGTNTGNPLPTYQDLKQVYIFKQSLLSYLGHIF